MEDIIDIIVTETTNLIEITSQPTDEIIDVNIIDNREDITLNVTPSVVEININSLTGNFGVNWGDIEGTLSNQTDLQNALNLKADLVGGKVPSSQLPSYVDDVVEVANYASLPVTGETGKIYITIDTNYIYRWTGSVYVEIKDSSAVWGAITGTLSNQTDLQNALNAKQNQLNGTGFVKASGTTISYDNSTYLTGSSTSGYVTFWNGANSLTGFSGFTYNTSTQLLTVQNITSSGSITGGSFVKTSGTSSQFLKADGSVDSSTYLTTGTAASTYLALAGGTMTGVLFGASASFSGYVGFNGNTSPLYPVDVSGSGRFSGDLRIESTNPRIYLTDTDNNPDYFISNTDGTFTVYDVTNSASRLTIGTTGAATFLNSVTSSGYYLTGMTSGSGALYYNSGANRVTVANYNTSGIVVFEVNGGTAALTLNSNSSATFASSISATDANFSGNVAIGTTFVSGVGNLQIGGSTNASLFSQQGTDTVRIGVRASGRTGISLDSSNTNYSNRMWYLDNNGANGSLYIGRPGLDALTIANSGAATFSSSVTANGSFNGFQSGTQNLLIDWSASSQITTLTNTELFFGTNAQRRMTISNGGNVGIGTTSPAGKLLVALPAYTNEDADANHAIFGSGTNGYGIRLGYSESGNSGYINVLKPGVAWSTLYIQSGTTVFNQAGVERFRIASNGDLYANSGAALFFGSGAATYLSASTSLMTFAVNNSERMRITSGGNVLIGTTTDASSAWKLQVVSPIATLGADSGLVYENRSNANRYTFYATGGVSYWFNGGNIASINMTTGAYTALSDVNKKKDFEESNIGLAEVMQLKPTLFRMKTDSNSDAKQLGFIAQEVKDYIPQAYTETSEGFIGLQDRPIIAALTKAVQELKAELDTLKNK
jgi:hypothetical protein